MRCVGSVLILGDVAEKSKSSGLEFREQKTSPLGSISINKNRVLWTQFP